MPRTDPVPASEYESGAPAAPRSSLASDIVELVVLTTDDGFLQTLREGVGASRRLWHVLSADKISNLLVAGGVGILVLDVQALHDAAARFVAGIKRQFPDLVIVVAGNRESETELARLISDGSIYRFIHKPMSLARATLFADAAVKRFQNQRRRTIGVAAAPIGGTRRQPRRISIGATSVAVAVAMLLAAGWLVHRRNVEQADVTAGAASARPAASTAQPGPAQSFPAVRSVLMEAQERLLARAQAALDRQRLDEAASTIEAARKTGIATERVAQLATALARAREQAKTAKEAPAAPRAASGPPASPASAETPASPTTVNTPSVSAPAAGPDAPTASVPAPDVPAPDVPVAEVPVHEVPAFEVPAHAAHVPALPASPVPAVPEPSAAAVPAPSVPASPVPPAEPPASVVPASAIPAAAVPASAIPAAELPASAVPAPALPSAAMPAAELPAPARPAPAVTTPAAEP